MAGAVPGNTSPVAFLSIEDGVEAGDDVPLAARGLLACPHALW
ncbi:hypothetical protein LX83_006022 [Goodfellowiella coeruleoviolacea]|uniref:Uncharacterized protein n=1 Tax=Goodfellowiella coeruleoviolacea TaxID=334858 RepID=A0AAE3GNA0_9PSEU|nr:hypothetical protein [Goodfellowiella coeruleoviolacea]